MQQLHEPHTMPAQVVSSALSRLANMSATGTAADGSLAAACAALAALFPCSMPYSKGWQPLEEPCTSTSGGGGSQALADLLVVLGRSGDSSRARTALTLCPHAFMLCAEFRLTIFLRACSFFSSHTLKCLSHECP